MLSPLKCIHQLREHYRGGKNVNATRYSVVIQWSEEDQAYLARAPELPGCITHGDTYEEALKNALEVIDLWIEAAQKSGRPIPPPRLAA
jgi:predicted RNase H-like HicB family nuclease